MADLLITSPSNPRVKALVAQRRRRARAGVDVTLVDGAAEALLAVRAGARIRCLYYCPELFAPGAGDALDRLRAAADEAVQLSPGVFAKVSYREGPDGILAVVDDAPRPLTDLARDPQSLVLIAQAVEKPGNLGAMLRTADGVGASAVIAADPVTDWANPNLVRASKGTVFSVPVASAPTAAVLAWLDERGIDLVATTPDTTLHYADVDYTGPIAIAVGTEKYGLSRDVLAAARYRVRIPMAGYADSLNVATAAAVVAYEAARQRRSASSAGR